MSNMTDLDIRERMARLDQLTAETERAWQASRLAQRRYLLSLALTVGLAGVTGALVGGLVVLAALGR